MDEESLLSYHRYTRDHGVNRPLYYLARLVLTPFFLLYFRLSRFGREHGKVRGPLIVAANHRSFLDPFVIAVSLPWRRPLHFVAKVELFDKRWQGWILNRLGANPARRPWSPPARCSSAAEPSASSPRGPGTGQVPSGDRSAGSVASRSSPARRSSPSRCTGLSRSAAGGRSARAR